MEVSEEMEAKSAKKSDLWDTITRAAVSLRYAHAISFLLVGNRN